MTTPIYFKDHYTYVIKNSPTDKDKYLQNINLLSKMIQSVIDDKTNNGKAKFTNGCRDTSRCFKDGQKIRHIINSTRNCWTGVYNKNTNMIIYNNNNYTMCRFVNAHYRTERPDRTCKANAWKECETELEPGKWISTYTLPELSA